MLLNSSSTDSHSDIERYHIFTGSLFMEQGSRGAGEQGSRGAGEPGSLGAWEPGRGYSPA